MCLAYVFFGFKCGVNAKMHQQKTLHEQPYNPGYC